MPMKHAKMALIMIDVVVDDDLIDDGLIDDSLIDDGLMNHDIAFTPSSRIGEAVLAACASAGVHEHHITLCVRFASDHAVQALNSQWRNKSSVTDVLSFPMQEAPFDFSDSLGDIALAVPFIRQEAERLHLPTDDHYLHLIIHATLHLLGYDHINDNEATQMQALELQAMQTLQLHQPYPVDSNQAQSATQS